MHRKLTCFVALILVLALSARVVINLQRSVSDRKAKMEAAETNDGNDDKTEKDFNGESLAWMHHLHAKNWVAITTYQAKFFNRDLYIVLPKHFCAVPTPPPWA